MHALGGTAPVDTAIVEREFRSVGDVAHLRRGDGGTIRELVDHPQEKGRAGMAESLEQVAGGLHPSDGLGDAAVHVARVELGHELEHGGTGAVIACHDRALHGSGSPPARQTREMKIDPPETRGAQERFPNESAIRDDHAQIGFEFGDPFGDLCAQPISAEHRNARIDGGRSHRGRRELPATALRRIFPRDDRSDVVPRRGEIDQARHGSLGASGEYETEAVHGSLRRTVGDASRTRDISRKTVRGRRT